MNAIEITRSVKVQCYELARSMCSDYKKNIDLIDDEKCYAKLKELYDNKVKDIVRVFSEWLLKEHDDTIEDLVGTIIYEFHNTWDSRLRVLSGLRKCYSSEAWNRVMDKLELEFRR